MLEKFENSPYLGYKSKQVHNESTETYLFLIKYITKLIKSDKHVRIHIKFVKSGVNKKIGHDNETIGNVHEAIQPVELKRINVTDTCADKDKQTLSAYGIKGK